MDEKGLEGTVRVDDQIIYSLPRNVDPFRQKPGWQNHVLEVVGLPLKAFKSDEWWNRVEATGSHLAYCMRAIDSNWGANDFGTLARLAQRLQERCMAYADHSRHTESPAFALIGDLEILKVWANKSAGAPKKSKGAPRKDMERQCLVSLGSLFRQAFGARHSISGNHPGPFTRFVAALLANQSGVEITAEQIRSLMRMRSERGK